MEQQELEIYKKFEELNAANENPDLYQLDPEKAQIVASHKLWLKSFRHQRPHPGIPFKVGVYIRYFNQTKYENYLDYHKKQFSDTIALCPAWTLVGFYIDNGASAPNMEKAENLCRLINDCMIGSVDLIITQKVSNLSKDPLEISFCSRMLASLAHPVGIYFISEDIYTLATYYLNDLRDEEFLPETNWNVLENKRNGGLLHD